LGAAQRPARGNDYGGHRLGRQGRFSRLQNAAPAQAVALAIFDDVAGVFFHDPT